MLHASRGADVGPARMHAIKRTTFVCFNIASTLTQFWDAACEPLGFEHARKNGDNMITTLKVVAATALIGAALSVSTPASAGHGNELGAGLLGLGIGAVVGSALTPQTVYVAPPPPPPPPAYYGPASYGPPPWSPAWYSYCRNLHGPYFNPHTGYFQGEDGGWYFCQ